MQIQKLFVSLYPTNVSHYVEIAKFQTKYVRDTDGSSSNVGCSSVYTYKCLAILYIDIDGSLRFVLQ